MTFWLDILMKAFQVEKRNVLKPKISILDEPDSGLDIDAVQIVAKAISNVSGKDSTTIIITHYARILNFLDKLDFVHVFADGKILKSGDAKLASKKSSVSLNIIRIIFIEIFNWK